MEQLQCRCTSCQGGEDGEDREGCVVGHSDAYFSRRCLKSHGVDRSRWCKEMTLELLLSRQECMTGRCESSDTRDERTRLIRPWGSVAELGRAVSISVNSPPDRCQSRLLEGQAVQYWRAAYSLEDMTAELL
jgi:hypothetical protein